MNPRLWQVGGVLASLAVGVGIGRASAGAPSPVPDALVVSAPTPLRTVSCGLRSTEREALAAAVAARVDAVVEARLATLPHPAPSPSGADERPAEEDAETRVDDEALEEARLDDERASQEVTALISAAVRNGGTWTADDVERFRDLSPRLSPDSLHQALLELHRVINAGALKVTSAGVAF